MNMSDDSTADTSLTINDDDLVVVEDLPEEETSDVEEQVHDQLPTVDEVKTNVSYKPAGNPSLKRTICAGVAFLLLVVGITLLVVFVPKSRKSGSSASYEPTSRQEDVIQLLLHNAITPEPALRDRYSAQAQAVQFIADGDSYQMAINEDTVEKFVERYVLAVFYYHFSGSTWTYKLNFMTSQDHCNWFQRFTTIAGDTLREGVMCNDKGHVTTVMLGELSMSNRLQIRKTSPSVSHLHSLIIVWYSFFVVSHEWSQGRKFSRRAPLAWSTRYSSLSIQRGHYW
jgi:hypothetical protein